MTRTEAIRMCRYYDGLESTQLHEERATLWSIERMWVEMITTGRTDQIERSIEEYVGYGLGEFQMRDNIPLSLKALLFNRLMSYDERIDVDAFKSFYLKYYKS